MTVTRREFLSGSGVAFGAALPVVFRQTAALAGTADRPGTKQTVLVVVQLTGGNDGLNTVIPYRDPEYARARPTLRQPSGKVLRINEELAFHPAMRGFHQLLEDSRLAIVQGVGYPNANRSHFASMDIWHKATRSPQEKFGWLGRALPQLGGSSAAVHIGGGEGPLALFSSSGHAPSLQSLRDYALQFGRGPFAEQKRKVVESLVPNRSGRTSDGLLDFLRQSTRLTYQSARQIQKVAQAASSSSAGYPQNGLGKRLQLIARLIIAGVPERVFYTSLGGFDTHAAQLKTHPALLRELAEAIAAFQKDLQQHGQDQRVLLMTFSEFGRRVRENGSAGTDHGAASQMFLVGNGVQPGPLGRHPSLTDLFRGDLKHHTDFRSVYATVLQHWLGVPPKPVLGREYPLLPLFRRRA